MRCSYSCVTDRPDSPDPSSILIESERDTIKVHIFTIPSTTVTDRSRQNEYCYQGIRIGTLWEGKLFSNQSYKLEKESIIEGQISKNMHTIQIQVVKAV